jgi:hypothetical protein
MSKHQLNIHGDKKRGLTVDRKQVKAYLKGEIGLVEALGLEPNDLAALRRQADALFSAKTWEACLEVLSGLQVLGNVELLDPMIMAECHRQLGHDAEAMMCEDVGRGLLVDLWARDLAAVGA